MGLDENGIPFFPAFLTDAKHPLLVPRTSVTFSLLPRSLASCLHQKCIRQLKNTLGFSVFVRVFSCPLSSIPPFQTQLTATYPSIASVLLQKTVIQWKKNLVGF